MKDEAEEFVADGTTVRVTHPDKVLFPQVGVTKRDIVRFYQRVAARLLPELQGRALVLHRYPDGVEGGSFYQKRAPEEHPEWVQTAWLPSPTTDGPIEYVLGENLATVLWLVNLGAFEMNPWLAPADRPKEPSRLVVDLDPMGGPFSAVCEVALLARDVLKKRGLQCSPKTSGKRGLHLTASLSKATTYPAVREMLHEVGRELEATHPGKIAIEERRGERHGLVYFDYNQNGYGSTIASAWSVRPTPAATYSHPLTWAEVERVPDPAEYTVRGLLER